MKFNRIKEVSHGGFVKQDKSPKTFKSLGTYFYDTVDPNGISANFISLKCCKPNGMPIMVIQRSTPQERCSTARGMPVVIIQIIFKIREPVPPPKSTSFPNGKKESPANLKHCIPTGIPIIVIHHNTPANSQLRPPSSPPQKNHRIFPRQPMLCPPFILYIIICVNCQKCNTR